MEEEFEIKEKVICICPMCSKKHRKKIPVPKSLKVLRKYCNPCLGKIALIGDLSEYRIFIGDRSAREE